MAKINVMPKHLAELIAAGEVVERPASIVKELLENSVDAGATTVNLEIKNGGISYIRITDNGCGIAREDVHNAFVSHATSKLTTIENLNSILTLGFRGEALASIGAVASVDMLTRTEDETMGTRYCMEFGEETVVDDAGCPIGTTIIVRDLFMKTPARMKFLRKDVTEANAIAAVVDRIALSHPEVSFRFIREGKQVLMTGGKGDLYTTIAEVLGRDFASQLISCEGEANGLKVSGFISKPQFSRPNRNMQYFFINNRYVKTGTGSAAISEGYKNSIMVGKFPSCIINIEIDPTLVDVNVHPAKTEVRFTDERPIFNAVYSACRNALAEKDTPKQVVYQPKHTDKNYLDTLLDEPKKAPEQIKIPQKKDDFWQKYSANDFTQKAETKQETKVQDKPVPYTPTEPVPYVPKSQVKTTVTAAAPIELLSEDDERIDSMDDILLNSPNEKRSATVVEPETVSENQTVETQENKDTFNEEEFHLVGEAFRTYIICEYKKKLVYIDKHAAHERIIYEKLKRENGERSGQLLLMPITVTLSKDEYSALLENTELINSSGFEVEDFGGGCVIVRECPMELSPDDVPDVIAEIAGRFVEKKQDVSFEKLDWIFHSVACRSAIKAGDFTDRYEMEVFAKQLLSMPNIRYCPHGRPVLIEMTQRELEKNFGRI